MFSVLTAQDLERAVRLRHTMLADRGRQFVDRHRWDLQRTESGLEIDEYDDDATTYCVTAESGRHLASVRLRPARAGCMVEKHFPVLWGPELAAGVEITRLCTSPALTPSQRLTATSDLLLGLCRHCQRSGVDRFFGVVFPAAFRAVQQAGWKGRVLRSTTGTEGALLLVEWEPSELAAWQIQERRELREEAWARRHAADCPVLHAA